MEKIGKRLKVIVPALFMLYLVILVWIILFKMQFALHDIDHVRSINLIPFYYSTSVGEQFHITEVTDNFLIFIPFGILLSMLTSKMKLRNKILIIFGTSLVFEMMQYVLAIGSTDITDLITNVSGGVVGIALYTLFLRAVKNKQKADTILSVIAGIAALLFLGLISILLLSN